MGKIRVIHCTTADAKRRGQVFTSPDIANLYIASEKFPPQSLFSFCINHLAPLAPQQYPIFQHVVR